MKLFYSFVFVILIGPNLVGQKANEFINIINSSSEVTTLEKQSVLIGSGVNSNLEFALKNQIFFSETVNPFLNTGAFNKVTWIKVPIKNNASSEKFIFEFNQTYVDSLEFFVTKKEKLIKEFPKKGLYFKNQNSDFFLSNKYAYVYPIKIKKNDSVVIYIKAIVNDGAFRVLNKIWTEKAYESRKEDIKVRTSYLLVFSGFIALILILSLTMYLFSKQRMYVYYFGFVLVVFINLLCLRHLISPVLIQDSILFGNNFVEMFSYLQVFFMLMYATEFLSLKKRYPKFYFLLHYLALMVITIFVFGLFLREFNWFYKFSYSVSKILLGTVSILIYYIAFYLIRKKEKMAYYFVIAYFPLLTFVIHFILTALKLTSSYNPVQWEFVIFFEVVVLAVAMAHKYFLVMRQNMNFQTLIIKQKEEGLVAILSAQEEERERIAKDLHDGVVQQIGSVLLRARNIFTSLSLLEKNETQELLSSLENSNEELRNISHQMMPRTLKELGIVSAMDDLLNKSLTYADINFVFEYFNINERISKTYELILFRVLQELINNIIKHSKAKNVNVQLFKTKDSLVLLVEDDGVGFESTKETEGIGLKNIVSRIDTVEGTIHFESNVKKGTLVTVKIPYK